MSVSMFKDGNYNSHFPPKRDGHPSMEDKLGLPTDAQARKNIPIATGFLDYFPLAIAAVAEVSLAGSRQHHPDKPLHWDRNKSTDESDALMRHFIERGTFDSDGIRHSAKVAWRALALLQKELERANEEAFQEGSKTKT